MNYNAIICDKDGNALSPNFLDKEICNLLGYEVDATSYALFRPRSKYPEGPKGDFDYLCQINWYDLIYNRLESGLDFQGIISEMEKDFSDFLAKGLTLDDIDPNRMKVLRMFIERGYQSRKVY